MVMCVHVCVDVGSLDSTWWREPECNSAPKLKWQKWDIHVWFISSMQSRSSQTHTDTHKHTQSHIQCNPWMHEHRQKHTHLFVICYLGVAVVQEVKSSTDCKVGGLIHGCSSNDPEPQVAPAVFTGVWKCVWYNFYMSIYRNLWYFGTLPIVAQWTNQ